jgi:hypothetical protein
MTDLTEIYEDGSGPPRYVVRLSRTAQGVRTYTVGASLPEGEITERSVTRLFDLERAVLRELDGPRRSAARAGRGVTATLRRSIIVEELRIRRTTARASGLDLEGWTTTPELVAGISGAKRSQLVADLAVLVRDGLVEVQGSKGRTPSRYRLAAQKVSA